MMILRKVSNKMIIRGSVPYCLLLYLFTNLYSSLFSNFQQKVTSKVFTKLRKQSLRKRITLRKCS